MVVVTASIVAAIAVDVVVAAFIVVPVTASVSSRAQCSKNGSK